MRMRSRSLDRRKSAGFSRVTSLDAERDEPSAILPGDDGAFDRDTVRRALANLPAEQRQVLELGYFEGLSSTEIAARIEVPVGTVKSRVAAALSRSGLQVAPSGADRLRAHARMSSARLRAALGVRARHFERRRACARGAPPGRVRAVRGRAARRAGDAGDGGARSAARGAAPAACSIGLMAQHSVPAEQARGRARQSGPAVGPRLPRPCAGTCASCSKRMATAVWEASGIPGVDLIHVEAGPRAAHADAGLIRFAANTPFPFHSHQGDEGADHPRGRHGRRRGRACFAVGDAMLKGEGTSNHSFICGRTGRAACSPSCSSAASSSTASHSVETGTLRCKMQVAGADFSRFPASASG